MIALQSAPGRANEPDAEAVADAQPSVTATEAWVGAEATASVWSIYSGLTWAPLGSVREDGWRVRLVSGVGQYHYTGQIDGARHRVNGAVAFGDVLAGYHLGLGPLTLKMFVGGSFDGHQLTPSDPRNPVADRMIGVKAVLEAWLNLGTADWASLDLSWSTAHDSYFSRLRLGHRVAPAVSLGIEGGAYGNQASQNGRAGGFVRYEWDSGEVSVSGGVTGDIAKPNTPYATVVYVSRF